MKDKIGKIMVIVVALGVACCLSQQRRLVRALCSWIVCSTSGFIPILATMGIQVSGMHKVGMLRAVKSITILSTAAPA